LSRHPRFEQISPEVGELDEAAIDEAMNENPDETLSMIADLTAATDPKLRAAARQLAGRLMLDIAGSVARPRRGMGRIVTSPFRGEGDIDLDASTEAFEGRGARRRSGTPLSVWWSTAVVRWVGSHSQRRRWPLPPWRCVNPTITACWLSAATWSFPNHRMRHARGKMW
jgi:hypothetical protein